MKTIHAIYEGGVFRPLDAVNLPEMTEVVFEPRPVLTQMSSEARAEELEVMTRRTDPGEAATADDAPEKASVSPSSEATDHTEPMGSLSNAEIDRAIYGG